MPARRAATDAARPAAPTTPLTTITPGRLASSDEPLRAEADPVAELVGKRCLLRTGGCGRHHLGVGSRNGDSQQIVRTTAGRHGQDRNPEPVGYVERLPADGAGCTEYDEGGYSSPVHRSTR